MIHGDPNHPAGTRFFTKGMYTMRHFVIPGMTVLAACMISGCMFDSDDKDDVKKGSVSGKVTMIVTGEPVAGVKVMLVNRDAKVDTTDYSNNRAAFVDSAVTGSNGAYVIDGIKPGTYCIVPVDTGADTTATYRFTPAQDSGTYEFAMNGDTRTVDFIAEKSDYPGVENGKFQITIAIHGDRTKYQLKKFTTSRRKWIVFIPFYDFSVVTEILHTPTDIFKYSMTNDLGFTAVLATVDNYFKCVIEYTEIAGGAIRTQTFDIGFPLGNTPASSEWKYVIETGALTLVQ